MQNGEAGIQIPRMSKAHELGSGSVFVFSFPIYYYGFSLIFLISAFFPPWPSFCYGQ